MLNFFLTSTADTILRMDGMDTVFGIADDAECISLLVITDSELYCNSAGDKQHLGCFACFGVVESCNHLACVLGSHIPVLVIRSFYKEIAVVFNAEGYGTFSEFIVTEACVVFVIAYCFVIDVAYKVILRNLADCTLAIAVHMVTDNIAQSTVTMQPLVLTHKITEATDSVLEFVRTRKFAVTAYTLMEAMIAVHMTN